MTAPECALDFYSDRAISEPVWCYDQMLAKGPVVWMPAHGFHAVVGFEAVQSVLRDHRNFRSGAGVSIDEDVNRLLIGSTLNSDPPDHDRTRAITFRPLSPKALEDVKDRIARRAEEVVEDMLAKGQFDAASELAPYLPLNVVRDLVGLGDHGKANMLCWGGATFELMGDPKERRAKAVADMKALRAFLEDPATLEGLNADGWAQAATRLGIERGMTPQKAAELMRDYIAPSLDTTISAIGYAMMLFSQNPSAWEMLRRAPELLGNAIEEIVRLNTPIRAFTRRLDAPAEIAGVPLQSGERVLVVYGAANRDPARFEDPHRFDIHRNTRGHMGFGHGVHTCLGMHLARLEMRTLFEILLERVERFEPAGPVVPAINSSIHALAHVPVRAVA